MKHNDKVAYNLKLLGYIFLGYVSIAYVALALSG